MTKELATFNGIAAVVLTTIAQALGGWDMALQVLVALVVLDYISGLTVAVFEKKLSSAIGSKGIAKKVFVFLLVYISVLVDKATGADIIRTLTIMFYIANEGISILENAGKLGVPYPKPLKDILIQLKKNSEGEIPNVPE
jgi:toxin secretion/phage lysis holin